MFRALFSVQGVCNPRHGPQNLEYGIEFHGQNPVSSPPSLGSSLGRLHMGGQSVNGGGGRVMRGEIDLMGGPNLDRLYHKLKVLLLLSCNYTMQFIGYSSIKTR